MTVATANELIERSLRWIMMVAPEHKIMLVLRHPDDPGRSAVFGDDTDTEAAIRTIREQMAKPPRELE